MRRFFAALVLTVTACSQAPPRSPTATEPVAAKPTADALSASPPPVPSAPEAGAVPPQSSAAALATLSRSACYGHCPAYTLTIRANGVVEYDGESFVKVKGKAVGKLNEAELARLRQAFASAKFGSFADSYENKSRTDAPSVVVSFADGARVKTVRHYRGDASAPPELSKLEEEVDAIAHVEQWIGTPEERSKNAAQWGR